MPSEFACDLACGNIPQDHSLVRATGTNVAVVIRTVDVVNGWEKKEKIL